MASNGGRIAGIVAVVVSVLIALFDLLYYMSRHPRRSVVILIVCGVLLVLGIILVAVSGRKSSQAPVQ